MIVFCGVVSAGQSVMWWLQRILGVFVHAKLATTSHIPSDKTMFKSRSAHQILSLWAPMFSVGFKFKNMGRVVAGKVFGIQLGYKANGYG